MYRPQAAGKLAFLSASTIILCLALWVRVAHLYSLPVFVDEANHLVWAQRFSVNDTVYPLFMDGKFLMGVLVSLFRPLGPGPLWIARAAIALTSIPAAASCIAAGSLIGLRRAGLLAGLLYALLPQAVFHERQLLADPLMAAFGSLALVFTLQLSKKNRWRGTIPLAASLAAAFLTKFFGGLYVAFPLLAAIMLPGWRGKVWRQVAAIGLAVVIAALFVGAFYSRLGYDDQKLAGQQIGFVGCPPLVCRGDLAAQTDNLQRAFRTLLDLVQPYFGWPIILLACLAWPLSTGRQRKQIGWLAPGASGMLAAFVAIARDIPPRYIAFMAAPVVVLGAHGLVTAAGRSRSVAYLFVIACLWPMSNTAAIVFNPTRADLPNLDRQQYVTQDSSGGGFREAAGAVLRREAASAVPPVVLVGNTHLTFVYAYFDRARIDVRGLGEAYPADIGRWLNGGQAIYIIDEPPGLDAPGLLTEEIGLYPRMEGAHTVRLRFVTGTDSALREEIFGEFFIKPEKLAAEYQAFVDTLPQTEAMTLLVYPPNQARTLAPLVAAARPDAAVIPIGDSWPLDAAAAEDELRRIAAQHSSVRVAFVEETIGDPQRRLETWLNTRLYRIEEQWFGPVRVVSFAGEGAAAQTIPVGARFGDSVTLESVEVLDSVSQPGGLVRIRLNWRAGSTISQSLKVFTHLFAGEAIAAQHDGQPVGELRPTNTWQAGEAIVDQFAIRLPADVQPGEYQLRIGVYDVSSLARLPVSLPDGTTGEFFVGGTITIR